MFFSFQQTSSVCPWRTTEQRSRASALLQPIWRKQRAPERILQGTKLPPKTRAWAVSNTFRAHIPVTNTHVTWEQWFPSPFSFQVWKHWEYQTPVFSAHTPEEQLNPPKQNITWYRGAFSSIRLNLTPLLLITVLLMIPLLYITAR